MPPTTPTLKDAAAPARWLPRSAVELAALICLGLAWYWPTRRAGWVTDILGLAPRLTEANGLDGAWTGYGSPVFHPLTLGLHYLLWHLGGPSSLLYYAVWVGLHAGTAYLLVLGVRALTAHYRLARGRESAWVAGLAFLIYPYVVEPVVWRATLNYLLCVPLLLGASAGVFAFAKTGHLRALALSLMAALLALLCFDLAWVTPALAALAVFAGARLGNRGMQLRRLGTAVSTHTALLAAYLLTKSAVIGTAVGHYGAGVHLDFDPGLILPNAWRQLTKALFLTRELPFARKEALNNWLGASPVYGFATALAVGLLAWWLWRLGPRSRRWRLSGLLGIGALVAIAPTANLYYYWVLGAENDRYSYFPAVWTVALLSVAWGGIGSRAIRYGLAAVALVAYGYFNRVQVMHWAEASYAQHLLLEAFPAADEPGRVYVLAAADNYQGTYLFRDGMPPYTGVDANLRYLRERTSADTVENLVNYNQMSLEDSVAAVVNARGEIELSFRQGGNWFWRGGIGLSDYERPSFRVTAGYPVRVCFKEALPPGTRLLYPTGRTWTSLPTDGLRTCREVDAQ